MVVATDSDTFVVSNFTSMFSLKPENYSVDLSNSMQIL